MNVYRAAKAGSVLLLSLTLLSACQSASFGDGKAGVPFPQVADRPRSLACDSPELQQAQQQAQVYPWGAAVPWYEVRNEARVATEAGYDSPTYESATTYTYDQQTSYNGCVQNNFNSSTYRVRTIETVR
jgi:hypothetical protein